MTKLTFGRVADPDPAIIEHLRVLRHEVSTPAEIQRAHDYIDALLLAWRNNEDMTELRAALGVASTKKRRRSRTVAIEWNTALAVMSAAMNGHTDAFDRVATDHQLDIKRVERAWKEWRGLCVPELEQTAKGPEPFASKAAAALKILDRNS